MSETPEQKPVRLRIRSGGDWTNTFVETEDGRPIAGVQVIRFYVEVGGVAEAAIYLRDPLLDVVAEGTILPPAPTTTEEGPE